MPMSSSLLKCNLLQIKKQVTGKKKNEIAGAVSWKGATQSKVAIYQTG
jgi:hypothetical protein